MPPASSETKEDKRLTKEEILHAISFDSLKEIVGPVPTKRVIEESKKSI